MDAAPSVWTLGSSSTIKWPSTARAGTGNAGVAQIIKSTPGAIGYVDYADAKASGLTGASVKNSAGSYVAPSPSAASVAAAGVTVAIATDHPVVPIHLLIVQAALAMKEGLDRVKELVLDLRTVPPERAADLTRALASALG